MNIVVTYVFPIGCNSPYYDLAIRYVSGYNQFPPGVAHETLVVCNGGRADDETKFVFGSIPNCRFIEHDNSGYDCGAFQHAARNTPCDLMVFFGASTYLKSPGWLKRMAEAYSKHGPGLYGSIGNRGNIHHGVHPHIRTTGFWMSPDLLNKYPTIVSRPEQRYAFEHGPDGLTSWVYRQGLNAWVVTWAGVYSQPHWDASPNGFHRGNQSDLLAGDRLTEPPFYACP